MQGTRQLLRTRRGPPSTITPRGHLPPHRPPATIPHVDATFSSFLREVTGKAPVLTPAKLLAIALFLLATGGALFFDARAKVLPALPWVVMSLGLAVLRAAARARSQRMQLEQEVMDVIDRWHELAAGIAAAAASGQSVPRYLQAQGIRRYEVRRYLVQQVQGGVPMRKPDLLPPETALPMSLRHDGRSGRPRAEPPDGRLWLPKR